MKFRRAKTHVEEPMPGPLRYAQLFSRPRERSGAGRKPKFYMGTFSAVSMPNFVIKVSFERSRRDLHNTQLSTDLR